MNNELAQQKKSRVRKGQAKDQVPYMVEFANLSRQVFIRAKRLVVKKLKSTAPADNPDNFYRNQINIQSIDPKKQ